VKPRVCWVFSAEVFLRWFLLDHLSALSKHFDFTLLLPRSAESPSGDGDLPGEIVRVPMVRRPDVPRDIRALVGIVNTLSRGDFDLVHSFMPKAGLLVSLARIVGFPGLRLHTFTGQVWLTRRGLARASLKAFDRLIAYTSDVVIADSWSQTKLLASSGVTLEKNVVVLGQGSFSGVDLERFDVPAETRSALRAELGIPEAEGVIVFLGRLNRDKGVLDLARAAADLVNQGLRFYLIIVGPDEEGLSSRIRRLCATLGERLLLPGLTSSPERWLAIADVFCLPSFREGFGTSIIEAAAAGVPAVASRIPGLVDAVEDGETGLLVEPGDAGRLSGALAELLSDRARTAAMGVAARARAKERFSRQRSIDDWFGLYSRLLQKRPVERTGVLNDG
jgi:glycosyltransferase involved in cell wall biosynthesis